MKHIKKKCFFLHFFKTLLIIQALFVLYACQHEEASELLFDIKKVEQKSSNLLKRFFQTVTL